MRMLSTGERVNTTRYVCCTRLVGANGDGASNTRSGPSSCITTPAASLSATFTERSWMKMLL